MSPQEGAGGVNRTESVLSIASRTRPLPRSARLRGSPPNRLVFVMPAFRAPPFAARALCRMSTWTSPEAVPIGRVHLRIPAKSARKGDEMIPPDILVRSSEERRKNGHARLLASQETVSPVLRSQSSGVRLSLPRLTARVGFLSDSLLIVQARRMGRLAREPPPGSPGSSAGGVHLELPQFRGGGPQERGSLGRPSPGRCCCWRPQLWSSVNHVGTSSGGWTSGGNDHHVARTLGSESA